MVSEASSFAWLPAALFRWVTLSYSICQPPLTGPGLATYCRAVPLLCTLSPFRICVDGVLRCVVSIGAPLVVDSGTYPTLLRLSTTALLLDALGCTPVGGVHGNSQVP